MILSGASLMVAVSIAAREPSRVIWRDAHPPAVGEALDATDGGVVVGAGEPGKTQLVAWQRVRGLEGPLAGPAARFASEADALWRLERRVLRGDYRLAEELAESKYQQLTASGLPAGPSSALVLESVLRCRLARGYTTGAIAPAMDLATVLGTSGPTLDTWIGWSPEGLDVADPRWRTGPLVDREMLLCPFAPPVFDPTTPARSLAALAQSQAWSRWESGTAESAAIASVYRFAANAASAPGLDGVEIDLAGKDLAHPGVKLVRWIVEGRYGSDAQRRAARQALMARITDELRRQSVSESAQGGEAEPGSVAPPRWVEAWCRLGVGLSLLRERDPASHRLGVVHLLHIPARFGDAYPSLAALALSHAAAALTQDGDAAGAARLTAELTRFDPAGAPPASPAGAPGAVSSPTR